jgi:hypothetical protein
LLGWRVGRGVVGTVFGRSLRLALRVLRDSGFARPPGFQFFVVLKANFPAGGFFSGPVNTSSFENDFGRVFEEGSDHGGVKWGKVDER